MFIKEKSNFIVGRYKVKINSDYEFEEAMEIIAAEESVGIESVAFTNQIRIYAGVTDLPQKQRDRFGAKYKIIERYDHFSGLVNFYFPIENILQENGTVNILFSTLMGDLFGLEVVKEIFLLDIFWPSTYLAHFPGPKFGVEGVKHLLRQDYPLFGVIIKPNFGLTPKETGKLVYNLALGGASFIKDDELLSSTKHSPIFDRLGYCMEALAKAKKVTGKECLFALNITSDAVNTHQVALEAVRRGANCLMLNLFAVGFDVLKEITADRRIQVPIHTHRCMHDIFTSRGNFGVSLSVFSELARMCGADFFHVGTVIGKKREKLEAIKKSFRVLTSEWTGINKTIPISSRSSVLSIGPTYIFFGSKEMMYLSCGSIYKRGKHYLQESVRGMQEAISYQVHEKEKVTKAYYNSKKFAEDLRKNLL